ncbi:hypothetical protein C8R43DRAFT_1126293 [Mycena crocata]|nr:hypothetical protein C8R43DRAFT_1126293 [Mycena crocata]
MGELKDLPGIDYMFQPFDNTAQFYPGLILWCDPNSYEMEISTLAPNEVYDRKKAKELRPCLVVAVNHTTQSFQVARICATTPTDTRRWVRMDSTPTITWRLTDAWIWVGTPPTVAMVLNNPKVMHPHKDTKYTTNPVAATNLQNYWVHRQNYLSWREMSAQSSPGGHHQGSTRTNTTSRHSHPAPSPIYSTPPNQYPATQPVLGHASYFNHMPQSSGSVNPYPASPYYPSGHAQPPTGGFNTLSPHPVVVPAGFTETHPGAPGWWRNPETGWLWHASRGLLPPK